MGQHREQFRVRLIGASALLMHRDNIAWADELKRWLSVPENKSRSIPGDDRSPAFTWLGSLYHDERVVSVPADNLAACFKEGGTDVPVPGSKHGKTFKKQTQSGMVVVEDSPTLLVKDSAIDVRPLLALKREEDFGRHVEAAAAAGFMLMVKRARVQQSKHIRVRPRFDNWSTEFTLDVWDEQITLDALKDILRFAGEYKGLGDWRPSSRTPGPFGRFRAEIVKV